jgi:hypothetical protein
MSDEQNIGGENYEDEDVSDHAGELQETPNIKSQTDNMDVHHHPDLSHKKKNWKEYLLEFFMLFLAVTLGFFAENIREHSVENARARQYAILLIQDIKKNSRQADEELGRRKIMQRSFDTLKGLLANDHLDSNFQIVRHVMLLSETLPFSTVTATFDQMQNSGSLRYMRNEQLTSLLTDYFNTLVPATQKNIEQEFQVNMDNNQKFIQQHFNLLQVDTSDNVLVRHPDIYDWNKRSAVEMYNMTVNTSTWNEWIMEKYLLPIRQQGNALIEELQREYDLH